MAPTTSKPRVTNFTDIGVAGRKTGITVKDTGHRDAHGMESMDNFFSPSASPDKDDLPHSSPAKMGLNQTISIEESMDIVTSEPASRLNRASLPPRARSPIKTTLNSPARRASSVGFSSPVRRSPQAISRRLDFTVTSTIESSPVLPALLPSSEASTTRMNGGSSSAGEKTQGKLAQVVEEETSVMEETLPVLSLPPPPPPPPPPKQKKRGLLVQRRQGEKKKAFSMDVGTDDEETGDEERDAFEEGLSQILDDSVVVGDDTDIAMTGVQQEDTEEEAQPAQQKGKAAKAKAAPMKKTINAQPSKAKTNGAKAKPAKAKAPESEPESKQESEPTPLVKAKPAPKNKGKKTKPVEEPSEEETADEPPPPPPPKNRGRKTKPVEEPPEEEPESEPAPQAKTKPAPRGKGKKAKPAEDPMKEDASDEPAPPPPPKARGKKPKPVEEPSEEEAAPPPKPKPATKGKARSRAKAIQEEEEIPESEQEPLPLPEPISEDQNEEPQQPAKKRPRTTKSKPAAKTKGKQPAAPKKTKEPSPELQSYSASPAPTSKTAVAEPASSSSSQPPPAKKGGQRIIKEKPPPPPAPRYTSEDPDGVRRSSRTRIEPLAFWKNEKIVYGLGARRKSGHNMSMPEIVEIVRVESDPESSKKKAARRKRTAAAAAATTTGAKRKREEEEGDEEDDFDEEDWESKVVDGEVGVVRGYVKTYHDPPKVETPGEEELEERELAFSRNRIVTVEVANGDFTFVKTCTEDFFGTGMVEIPPGGIKRTKNSGKMHLVFYVISGKVEVKIGENEFRVRKGSQFMVPRGNLYSIANPYDSKAKMFFAQGCEKVIRPEGEEEEEEE